MGKTEGVLRLSEDSARALEEIRAASADRPVLVFKKSPICPISHDAEAQVRKLLGAPGLKEKLSVAEIDVIAERALARGLVKLLEVEHQSPQALLFFQGTLRWHASHSAITRSALEAALGALG